MSALIMEHGKRELLLDRIKEHKYFPPKLLNVYILFYGLPWWLRWLKKKKKNQPVIQETWDRSLGWEDLLEKGMANFKSDSFILKFKFFLFLSVKYGLFTSPKCLVTCMCSILCSKRTQ